MKAFRRWCETSADELHTIVGAGKTETICYFDLVLQEVGLENEELVVAEVLVYKPVTVVVVPVGMASAIRTVK